MRYAINYDLKAKGYTLIRTGKSDLVVVTHAGVQEKMKVTTRDDGCCA